MTSFETVLIQFFGITFLVGICLGIAIFMYRKIFSKEDTI
ncbi:hypothetical protein FDI40_gp666 [Agrobacterium phage Atu_ph07]|uniref:Uncharacterized protein n=1 Tax=Agrobacterium phage Atu_ph07 TaxID=2024264 RepID=A0A2L0V0W6_9CAUD|nr:hypothetical protein FDI40_gp666 [Agrobacterium phage Atu_ph07]AUZ95423.1 hypothetical protein [Agrobacterium phage Atu_ph07]